MGTTNLEALKKANPLKWNSWRKRYVAIGLPTFTLLYIQYSICN